MRFTRKMDILISCLCLFLLAGGEAALAQGNSDNAPGRNRNLGHNNASDGVMALISANRQIFYSGDPLQISIRFPRGAELITSGEVDAHLLIFKPNAEILALPVSSEASTEDSRLFDIAAVDVEALPPGLYQLGLVITVPDGDPLDVEHWYNGLLGLVTLRGLTVSDEPLDIDADGDGEVDEEVDPDGDGIADDCDDDPETELPECSAGDETP